MQPHSSRFDDAVRTSHTLVTIATHRNLITGVSTALKIEDGSITDDATSQVRRSLSLTVPNEQATWDALDTVGGEITVQQGVRYVDGGRELLPMGVFVVDTDQIGYGPGGTIAITAPDRWGKVAKNTLPPSGRASVASHAAWQEIQRLVEGAWNATYPFPGWSQLDTSATAKVGSLLWDDGNRESAARALCTDNSVEVFFDRTGKGVLRPVPVLTDTSPYVATIDAGARGVLLDADRTRDRTGIANVIIVSTSATDVTFTPQEVKNTTAGDPLSVNGPLGYMAVEYASPSLRNSAQALAAGRTMLAKTLGVAKQLSLTAAGNPALDSEDVILAVLPRIDRSAARPSELHILDTVVHPLTPTGTQSLSTRSTRPATDGT